MWGWLRSQIAHHLKNMTLNNIPNRACLIVKGASTLYAEVLCHRDLDTFNVLTIPERFEKRSSRTGMRSYCELGFRNVVSVLKMADSGNAESRIRFNSLALEVVPTGLLHTDTRPWPHPEHSNCANASTRTPPGTLIGMYGRESQT